MGGDIMGKSPMGEDYENLRRKNYFGGEDYISGLRIFLVLGVWSGSFGEPLQGAPGCWGFWARGPRFLSVSWS